MFFKFTFIYSKIKPTYYTQKKLIRQQYEMFFLQNFAKVRKDEFNLVYFIHSLIPYDKGVKPFFMSFITLFV